MAFFELHTQTSRMRPSHPEGNPHQPGFRGLASSVFGCLLLICCLFGPLSQSVLADPPVSTSSPPATRLSIPWNEFSKVVEEYGQGVLLPHAEFEALWKESEEHRKAVPIGVAGVVAERCDIEVTLTDNLLRTAYLIDVNQLGKGLQTWSIPFQGIGIDRATVTPQGGNERGARLGRLPGNEGLVVFLDQPGSHRIRLETQSPAVKSGRRLLFSLPLMNVPSGRIRLKLPAGMNIWSDSGERLSDRVEGDHRLVDWIPDEGPCWEANLSPADEVGQAAEIRSWTETTLVVSLIEGHLNWQGRLQIHPLGGSLQQLKLRIPKGFRLIDADVEGLNEWSVSPVPDDAESELLSLRFRQPIRTQVALEISGIVANPAAGEWTLSSFRWEDGSPQTTRCLLAYEKHHLPLITATEGIRLEPMGTGRTTTDNLPEKTDTGKELRLLRFVPVNGDFSIRLRLPESSERFAADILSHTKLGPKGAESITELGIVALGASSAPNRINVEFPVEWTVTDVQSHPKYGDATYEPVWKVESDDASAKRLTILVEGLTDNSYGFVIRAVRSLPNWPLEQGVSNLTLPKWVVDSAYTTTGFIQVSSEESVQYRPLNLHGLTPTSSPKTQDNSKGADLGYRISSADYGGDIELTRYRSRLAAFSSTTANLDRDQLKCQLESVLQISGSGTREIRLTLPESCGKDLRFNLHGSSNEVVSQEVKAGEAGRNLWTLHLKQQALGELRVVAEIYVPRAEALEYSIPLVDYPTAERQNGQIIVGADAEQFLTVRSRDTRQRELPELGVSDLVTPSSHALPERVAAAFRTPGAGSEVIVSEQRFQPEILPGAVCDQLAIRSILDAGDRQMHEAKWTIRHGRVQSFILKLTEGQELWSAQLDGRPVEIHQAGPDEVKIKVPVSEDPLKRSIVSLLYGRNLAATGKSPHWREQPPQLVAEYSSIDRRPVEILDQNWIVYHPEEVQILQAEPPYQAPARSESGWWSWLWNIRFSYNLIPRFFLIGVIALIYIFVWALVRMIKRGVDIGRVFAIGILSVVVVGAISTVVFAPIPGINQAENVVKKLSHPSEAVRDALSEKIPAEQSKIGSAGAAFDDVERVLTAKTRGSLPLTESPKEPEQPALSLGEKREVINRSAKLSVAADLVVPPEFTGMQFQMPGISVGTPPILSLRLIDHRHHSFPFFLTLLIALMVVWFSARRSIWRLWFLVGICLPLGLGGLVTPDYHYWLQATLIGTILGFIGIGLTKLIELNLSRKTVRSFIVARQQLVSVLIFAAFLGGPLGGPFGSPLGAEEKPAAKVSPPREKPIVYTYADPAHPESSDQVWVPWEKYLELRNRVGRPIDSSRKSATGVYAAYLKADFPAAGTDPQELMFQARFSIYSDSEREVRVPLPIGKANIANGKLNGADANLVLREHPDGPLAVVIPSKGEHVLDLEIRVPVPTGDFTRGEFRLPIRSPLAGFCELKSNSPELMFLVNQPGGVHRKPLEGGATEYRFSLGNVAEPVIRWRPTTVGKEEAIQGEITSIVQVGSILEVTQFLKVAKLREDISGMTFVVPPGIHPTSVTGRDLEGWEWQTEGEKRLIRASLKPAEGRDLRIDLSYVLIPSVGAEGRSEVDFIPLQPLGFTPTGNRIGLVADGERQILPSTNPGWRQIKTEELKNEETHTALLESSSATAWEQTVGMSAPFKLTWKTRPSDVEIVAVNRWHLKNSGARFQAVFESKFPGSDSGWVRIPLLSGFYVDQVLVEGHEKGHEILDTPAWFISEDRNGDPILVILPSNSSFDDESRQEAGKQTIRIEAWFPLEPADLAEFLFPVILPEEATKLHTYCGISHDPSLQLELVAPDWKGIDPAAHKQSFGPSLPAFAFESDDLSPEPIEVRGTPSHPTIRGTSLTIIDVRDEALDYLLAFQWEVLNGEASSLVFTGPDWLKERIELVPPEGQAPPLLSLESLPGNRAQWTVTFDVPQRGKSFLIAKATLPVPPDGQVRGPTLQFVESAAPGNWKPLETQTHFQSLVNHSRNQLSLQTQPHHVRAHPDELQRAIQVPTPLLVQSVDLLREVEPLREPIWVSTPVEKTTEISASIGLATHQFWITGDDSWRSRVTYRVTNRRRQYLPVELPAGSRILAASASGQAVRVLSRKIDSKTVHLIPLPRMSAGDLPFDVSLTLAGTLNVRNPLWGNPTSLDIPLVRVVLRQENPDLGVDLTRENVEVYYPNRISATLLDDPARTNVQLTGDDVRLLDEIETLLSEVSELAEIGSSSSYDYQSQTKARSNLKLMEGRLDRARQQIESQVTQEAKPSNREIMRRSLQIRKQADELDRKLGELDSRAVQGQVQSGGETKSIEIQDLSVENRFQAGNTIELYNLNNAEAEIDSKSKATSRSQSNIPQRPGRPVDQQKDGSVFGDDDADAITDDGFVPIEKERPRHAPPVLQGGGGFGGGGGGFGNGDLSESLGKSAADKEEPAMKKQDLPSLGSVESNAPAQPPVPNSASEQAAPTVQSAPPPPKRVATLVSLDLDFHPTGKKQAFSRLQGGSKIALRLWPHSWFAGIARFVWFVAFLAVGLAVAFFPTANRLFPIATLAVALILATLFGSAPLVALAVILLLALLSLQLTHHWDRAQTPSRQ